MKLCCSVRFETHTKKLSRISNKGRRIKMFWILFFVVIISLILWFGYIKPYRHWKNMGIPQTKPWVILGDTWPNIFRLMNVSEWMDWIYYMYPNSRFMGMYQFYLPILVLKDPEVIKQITVKDFDHFTDHNSFTVSQEVDPLWSKNLFALKGQRWRDMRALLSGSFTSSKMKMMYALISETSENFVKHFLNKDEDFLEVEVKDCLTRYTNDVIASTAFGIKVDSLANPKNEFYLMGKEATNFASFTLFLKFVGMTVFPWLFKVLKIGFFTKRVTKFFTDLINETIKAREEQGIVRPDMINLLLEVKKGIKRIEEKEVIDTGFAVVEESSESGKSQKRHIEITNEDIASQAMIFFLAGFDSVATAMSFTCYELAVNTDIQNKLRKEIRETLENNDDVLSYEALLKMKYLDMVVTESLRKWPVAALADRVCVKPYTLEPSTPEEQTPIFQKKDLLWIPIYSIQNDPQYYPEPHKFIPERFSNKNKENIKPYTYMPFGIGPRACIGSRFALLEIKSIICNIVNSFEIVPVEKTQIPLKLSKKFFIVMPDEGFPLGLKRIQN